MIDCRSLEGMSVPAGNSQVKFLVTDSQVKHALVSAAQKTLLPFPFANENWSQQMNPWRPFVRSDSNVTALPAICQTESEYPKRVARCQEALAAVNEHLGM